MVPDITISNSVNALPKVSWPFLSFRKSRHGLNSRSIEASYSPLSEQSSSAGGHPPIKSETTSCVGDCTTRTFNRLPAPWRYGTTQSLSSGTHSLASYVLRMKSKGQKSQSWVVSEGMIKETLR